MTSLAAGCIGAWLLVAVLGVVLGRSPSGRPVVYGASAAIAVAALLAALLPGQGSLVLPIGVPLVGVHLRLDALSRAFLVLIDIGALGASLYAIGYGRHEHAPQRVLPFFPAFLAGMNLVVIADDAYTFLFAWELMSLASWALVVSDHRNETSTRAGTVYLLMASFGALALLLAFGLMAAPYGNYSFADIRMDGLPAWRAGLVLALVLVGAGSKAGLVPLHVWLPLAHPAAPSHVSALMSGVMTKVAIYAFIRVVFDLLGPPLWWWAVPALIVGGASAVIGVLAALMERDLKRLLACSTIENVGIIFIALGLAIAFRANALADAAALALTAALFHAFNHMLFKSVLFFGAGTVLVATGERNIERLGGLARAMPFSSAAVLLACMAISALPPLNGFASEWLTFQTILVSPDLPQWGLRLLVPTVGTMLALAAALAAACFVRAFGVTWLGRPRSAAVVGAVEADRWSLAVMGGFAALCVLAGVLPGLVIDALEPAVLQLVGGRVPAQAGLPWLSIVPVADSRSSYNGLMLCVFIGVSTTLAVLVIRRFASRAVRVARAWDCGYPGLGPATQYSAASYAQPIRRVFGPLLFRSSETVTMPPPGDLAAARIRKTRHDLAWEALYAPLIAAIGATAGLFNRLQFLTIRSYLSFVFLALVGLLLALGIWQ